MGSAIEVRPSGVLGGFFSWRNRRTFTVGCNVFPASVCFQVVFCAGILIWTCRIQIRPKKSSSSNDDQQKPWQHPGEELAFASRQRQASSCLSSGGLSGTKCVLLRQSEMVRHGWPARPITTGRLSSPLPLRPSLGGSSLRLRQLAFLFQL